MTKTKKVTKRRKGQSAMTPVEMWAWAIKDLRGTGWVLCKWAEPSRSILLMGGGPPSPEAKAVKVVCSVIREI